MASTSKRARMVDLMGSLANKVTTASKANHIMYFHQTTGSKCTSNPILYNIPLTSMEKFSVQYCKLRQERKKEIKLAFGEIPPSVLPVMIQLRLKYDVDHQDTYSDDFLYNFTYLIQQVLVQHLELEEMDYALQCCILESPNYEMEDEDNELRSHVDIRFHFPLCRCEISIQLETIIPHLLKRIRQSNAISSSMHSVAIGDWSQIIDTSIFSSDRGVVMYGSREFPQAEPMEHTRTLPPLSETDLVDPEAINEIQLHELEELFSLDDHSLVYDSTIRASALQDGAQGQDEIEYLKPLFLSVYYGKKNVMPRRRSSRSPGAGTYFVPDKKFNLSDFGKGGDLEGLSKVDMVKVFLPMIEPEMYLTYDVWLAIGEAIHDAYDGHDDGLEMWLSGTTRSIKKMGHDFKLDFVSEGDSIEDEASDRYYAFALDRTTVRSLAWFAKKSSPQAYQEWHEDWIYPAVTHAATTRLDSDIARAFYRVYWLDGLCVGFGRKADWYVFRGNHLRRSPNGLDFRIKLTGEFKIRMLSLMNRVIEEMKATTDADQTKRGSAIIAGINKLVERLSTSGCKTAIMSELSECFSQHNIDSYLDANPNLMGLKNGILVATTKNIYTREGRLEDYVTRHMNISYPKGYSIKHPQVQAVLHWRRQTWNDDELAGYVGKVFASLLHGGNTDKFLYVFAGESGDNAKSAWIRFLCGVLGPYAIKFPAALLTDNGRGDANGPTPALARAKGTRVAIAEELHPKRHLNGNLINNLTGDDDMYIRFMKKEGCEMKPLNKLFIVCNVMPDAPTGGKAFKNRFVGIPCNSVFSDEAPKDEAEQWKRSIFPRDDNFSEKFQRMMPAMLWLMVHEYMTYLTEGVKIKPKAVKKYTRSHWESIDVYFQFMADILDKMVNEDGEPDEDATLDMNAVIGAFKVWFKKIYPSRKAPDYPELRKELCRVIGPYDGEWIGVAFKAGVETSGGPGGRAQMSM